MTEKVANAMNNISVLCKARDVLLQGLIVEDVFGMEPKTAQALEDTFAFAMRECAKKLDVKDSFDRG